MGIHADFGPNPGELPQIPNQQFPKTFPQNIFPLRPYLVVTWVCVFWGCPVHPHYLNSEDIYSDFELRTRSARPRVAPPQPLRRRRLLPPERDLDERVFRIYMYIHNHMHNVYGILYEYIYIYIVKKMGRSQKKGPLFSLKGEKNKHLDGISSNISAVYKIV